MENPESFEFQTTQDGSPTLSLGEFGEWMHHRESAFRESVFIYDSAVEQALSLGLAPECVSVGLGLGYVECLIAGRFLREGLGGQAQVRTFESNPFLRAAFLSWLEGGEDESTLKRFHDAYDRIAFLTGQHLDVPPDKIRSTLRAWRGSGHWILDGTLDSSTKWPRRYGIFLYDAFSADTNPTLWTREFLLEMLENAARPSCLFATYASTSELRRALESSRFRVPKRPGFAGKRESTLAIRP